CGPAYLRALVARRVSRGNFGRDSRTGWHPSQLCLSNRWRRRESQFVCATRAPRVYGKVTALGDRVQVRGGTRRDAFERHHNSGWSHWNSHASSGAGARGCERKHCWPRDVAQRGRNQAQKYPHRRYSGDRESRRSHSRSRRGSELEPLDLFELKVEQLAKLNLGTEEAPRVFGEKNATKAIKAIERARTLPLSRWLFAVAIPDVGKTTATQLARFHDGIEDVAHSRLL